MHQEAETQVVAASDVAQVDAQQLVTGPIVTFERATMNVPEKKQPVRAVKISIDGASVTITLDRFAEACATVSGRGLTEHALQEIRHALHRPR